MADQLRGRGSSSELNPGSARPIHERREVTDGTEPAEPTAPARAITYFVHAQVETGEAAIAAGVVEAELECLQRAEVTGPGGAPTRRTSSRSR